jgi:hypothetical protein
MDQYRNEPYNPFRPSALDGSTVDESIIPELAIPEHAVMSEEESPLKSIASQLLGNVVSKEVNSAFGLGGKKEGVDLSFGLSKGSPHKDIAGAGIAGAGKAGGAFGGLASMLPLLIAGGALKNVFK